MGASFYTQDRRCSALNYCTPQQVVLAVYLGNGTTDP